MTSPTVSNPPPATRRCYSLASCRSEALYLLRTAIKFTAVLILLAWLVGIPGSWLAPFLSPHTAPWQVTCSRVTWNPMRGFIFHAVDMTQPGQPTAFSASATTLVVMPDYRGFLDRKFGLTAAHAIGGIARLPLVNTNEPGSITSLTVTGIVATVTISPDETTRLRLLAHSDLGTDLTVDGTILPAHHPTSPGLIALDNLLDPIQRSPAWMQRVFSHAHRPKFDQPPAAHLHMLLNLAHPDASHASVTWQAGSFTFREVAFSGASLEATYSNRLVNIAQVALRIDDRQLLVTGSYALTNDLFSAHVYGNLTPDRLALLLPARTRDPIDRLGIQWQGDLHAEGWIGPCTLAAIPVHWSGWLTLEAGFLNDLPVQRIFTTVKRTPDALTLQDGLLQGGSGPGQGKIRFDLTTDYLARRASGTLELGLELQQLNGLLPCGLRKLASWFAISTKPVAFTGTYSTPLDDFDQLIVQGDITGHDFTFRTSPVVQAQVGLVYSNNHVHLEPFNITCATGGITGMLHLNLTDELYTINLNVTANPHHVAPMAGTNLARYFRPYRFTDDIRIRVAGLVDVATDAQTDLAVIASGRKIGYWKLTADHLAMEARRLPGQLLITNIVGTVGRGSITGSVTVTHQPDIDLFEGTLHATNITLDSIATMLNPGSSNRYEGTLRGTLTLTGTVPDTPNWEKLSGTGRFRVDNGRLLMIPIFGGLSSLLGKIYPGLGFSEQNLAEASLRFNEGDIRTRDLNITGNLVSLAGRGSLDWNGQLNGEVQVHPFRDGSLASAVRILTLPLSKLLEFRVTGPITNPVWNAINIPML